VSDNLRLSIDAKGAKKGANDYTNAINRMQKSLRNLQTTQAAVARQKGLSGANYSRMAKSMAAMKGPSKASVRNTQAFGAALASIKAPVGLRNAAAQINAIGAAAARSAGALKMMNASMMGGMRGRGIGGQARQLTAVGAAAGRANVGIGRLSGGMRGLENSMSASYHMGSQLRVLFGALTLGNFTKGVYDASLAVAKFNNIMKISADSPKDIANNMAFVGDVAQKYGIQIEGAMDSYGRLAAAMKNANVPLQDTQNMFEDASASMRVFGLTAEQQKLVFYGIQQTFSKGVGSMEEFRRQIGEQLPGFFPAAQDLLRKMTGNATDSLEDFLTNRRIKPEFLIAVFDQMARGLGDAIPTAAERADAQIARLENSWFNFKKTVGENGVLDAISAVAQALTRDMGSKSFEDLAKKIGKGLGDAIRMAGKAAQWLIKNVDTVVKSLRALVAVTAIKSVHGMVMNLVAGFGTLAMTIGPVGALLAGVFLAGSAAAAYYWDDLIKIGETHVSVGTLAKQAWAEFTNFYDEVMRSMESSSKDSGSSIKDIFKDVVNFVISMFMGLGAVAANVGATIINILKKPIGAVSALFNGEFAKAGRLAAEAFSPSDILGELKKGIVETGHDIKQIFKTDHIGNFADAATGALQGIAKRAIVAQTEAARLADEFERIAAIEKDRFARKQQSNDANKPKRKELDLTDKDQWLNPGSTSDKNLSAASKNVKSIADAVADYESKLKALNAAYSSGKVSIQGYMMAQKALREELQEIQDPYASFMNSLAKENNALINSSKANDARAEAQEKANQMIRDGHIVTMQQVDAMAQLIEQNKRLNDSSSFEGYIAGLDDLDTALDKVTTQALDGLADGIADLVVDGKMDFQSLAKSILKEFIKIGVNQVFKSLFSPQQSKISPIQMGNPGAGIQSTTAMTVSAGSVAVNGTLLGAGLNQPGGMTSAQHNLMNGGAPKTATQAMQPVGGTLMGNGMRGTISGGGFTGAAQSVAGNAPAAGLTKYEFISGLTNSNRKMSQDVAGLIIHHTGGRGDAEGVRDVLNERNLGAQYVMERDGQIKQLVADGFKTSHMKDGQGPGLGLNNSNALGIEVIAKDNADWTEAQRAALGPFIDDMKAKNPGIGNNVFGHGEVNPHKRETEGMVGLQDWRNQQQNNMGIAGGGGIDPTTTSSITSANQALQQTGTQMQTLGQNATTANQQLQTQTQQEQMASQQKTLATQTETMNAQQSVMAHQQNGQAIQIAGTNAQQASPQFQQAGQSISQAGQQASMAGSSAAIATPGLGGFGSGIASLMGPLSQAVPGLGQFGGAIMQLISQMASGGGGGGAGGAMGLLSLLGGFKEGGLSSSPVSRHSMAASSFASAPHYAEGTTNTGKNGMGGMPAVLHPNEAVIPLSRGRSIPVEMPKDGVGAADGKGGKAVNVTMNISGVSDVDGFKRSEKQIQSRMLASANRASSRNN